MTAFTIELQVEAVNQSDVRDLATGIQAAVVAAQRRGDHAGVKLTGGPSISTASA